MKFDRHGLFKACRREPYNHYTLMQIIEESTGGMPVQRSSGQS